MAPLGRDKVEDILKGRDLKDVVSVRLAIDKLLDVIENEGSQEDGQTAVRALDNLVQSAPSEVGAGQQVRVIVSDRLDRLIRSAEEEIPRASGHGEAVAPYGESAQRILERIPHLVDDDHLRSVQRLDELCHEHARHSYGISGLVRRFGVPAHLASLELRRRENGELTGRLLVEALIESRQSFSPVGLGREDSRTVLDATVRFAGDDAVDLLVQALRDDDVAVRRVAAVLLPELADERALDALLDALSDNAYFSGTHRFSDEVLNPIPHEDHARSATETAFERIAAEGDINVFLQGLQHAEGAARDRLIRVARRRRDELVEPLVRLLGDAVANSDREMVLEVVRVLGMLRHAEGIEVLMQTLRSAATKDDRKVLVEVVRALKKIGSDATDALADALGDESAIVRAVAADILGRIGDERAAPALERCRNDDDEGVRDMVGAALERIESR